MAKFCSLFSGSSGNCVFVENKNSAILIDAGVSAKRITNALIEREFNIKEIGGVFVTHEHSDHISGIRVFCSRNNIPVYMTSGTYESMDKNGQLSEKVEYKILEDEMDMGDISVKYFHTSHDTPESCGYIIETNNRKIAVCTDLGVVTDEVHNAIDGSSLVLLESNHDVKMLQNNPAYPFPLKRRILSDSGHLSNSSCADEVLKLVKSGSTQFVLGHLSKENNMPPLAKETTKSMLTMNGLKENVDYTLSVASPQDNKTIIL